MEYREKSLNRHLITIAAVLGIVQGVFWFLMSLASTLLYEQRINPVVPLYGLADIDRTIYDLYLNKDNIRTDGTTRIICPKEFNYFMYFYLAFSFSLLVVSLGILWAAITGKYKRQYEVRLRIWTVNMIILSFLDFILLCLIAHDYRELKKQILFPVAEITVILVSHGIVMTLAARGFVVWIINVTFAGIFEKHLYELRKSRMGRHG